MDWIKLKLNFQNIIKKNELSEQLNTLIQYSMKKNVRHLKITLELSDIQIKNCEWKTNDGGIDYESLLLDKYQAVCDLKLITSFDFYHLVWENSPTTNLPRWQIIFGFKDFTGQVLPVLNHVKNLFADFDFQVEVNELKTFEEIKKAYNDLFKNTEIFFNSHKIFWADSSKKGYFQFHTFIAQQTLKAYLELIKKDEKSFSIFIPYAGIVPKQVCENDKTNRNASVANLLLFYCQKNNLLVNGGGVWRKKINTHCTYELFAPSTYFAEHRTKIIKELEICLPIEVGGIKGGYFAYFWDPAVEYFIQQPGPAVNENWIEFKNGIYIYDQAKFIPDKNICQETNQYCSKYFDTDWISLITQVA